MLKKAWNPGAWHPHNKLLKQQSEHDDIWPGCAPDMG